MTENNRLLELTALGQSVWLDDLRRDMLRDGTLKRLIDNDGVSGETSNPAIFEKAISQGSGYDEAIQSLAREGLDTPAIYEQLVVEDVREAADLFRGIYDATHSRDGYVSLEVSPHLAHQIEASEEEAERLWERLQRPNVMIKIPATRAGLPVIATLIEEGINVNATLLFSLDRYKDVIESYIAGVEARARRGLPLDNVASVASFFLSRIDVMVDRLLDEAGQQDAAERERAHALRGEAAIAHGRLAYQMHKELFAGARWEALAAKGARPQRLLWASTGTKDPGYSRVKYVDALVAPDTINTMPLVTLEAYRGEGEPAVRVEDDLERAQEVLDTLPGVGVDLRQVAQQLEVEGVAKFTDPFDKLHTAIAQQAKAATA